MSKPILKIEPEDKTGKIGPQWYIITYEDGSTEKQYSHSGSAESLFPRKSKQIQEEIATPNYSKWALLDRLYEAKRTYYNEGKTKLTDQEYDALESSIIAIHGADIFRHWTCVGYDEFKHRVIKNNLQHETDKIGELH